MNNLLQETINVLRENDLTPEKVLWVGSQDGNHVMSWEQFRIIADFEYYNDYGSNEIPLDLVVVGYNWWLERGEYDGSEWWEFKTLPIRKHIEKLWIFVDDEIKGK